MLHVLVTQLVHSFSEHLDKIVKSKEKCVLQVRYPHE